MKRVYKSAFSHDVARGIILQSAGTHFDPDLVLLFQSAERDFREIREEFDDAHESPETPGRSDR